jgi:hypothetical protein
MMLSLAKDTADTRPLMLGKATPLPGQPPVPIASSILATLVPQTTRSELGLMAAGG